MDGGISRLACRALVPVGAILLLICGVRPTAAAQAAKAASHHAPIAAQTQPSPQGVCPPLHLRDEDGKVIDPISERNANNHTHPADLRTVPRLREDHQGIPLHSGKRRTANGGSGQSLHIWARTPGNYGGTWCSPAPLYRYLSAKNNSSSNEMDMTSFSFITSGCGGCHPGGGPAEFDREGKRYDRWMSDPESGSSPGADNDFDGDYYQAWSETGVLEADCLLCHLPEYDFFQRKQLSALNFRSAPVGSGQL